MNLLHSKNKYIGIIITATTITTIITMIVRIIV